MTLNLKSELVRIRSNTAAAGISVNPENSPSRFLGSKSAGDFEVEDEQYVVADAKGRFHAVGDSAGRNRLRDQPGRDHRFFVGLLDQGFD